MEGFLENLRKELPEECIESRKKFEACKLSVDPDFTLNNLPLSRTKGCRNQFLEYSSCVGQFQERYWRMKNLAASIQGEKEPFDIEKERNSLKYNLTKNNYGLDKF